MAKLTPASSQLTLGGGGLDGLPQAEEGAEHPAPGLFPCCRHVTHCGVMCFPLMVQDVTQRGTLGK